MDEQPTSLPEPRCYGHVFDPAHRADSHHLATEGWPAHVWSGGLSGSCRHCPDPVVEGDRYVCVEGGVMHVRCVATMDASVLNGDF